PPPIIIGGGGGGGAVDGGSSTPKMVQVGSNAITGGLQYTTLRYNPATDAFLAINQEGFDDIVEIKRDGTFTNIASGFGLGGLQMDNLAVTRDNIAYVAEGHFGSVWSIVPAAPGGTRTLLADNLN